MDNKISLYTCLDDTKESFVAHQSDDLGRGMNVDSSKSFGILSACVNCVEDDGQQFYLLWIQQFDDFSMNLVWNRSFLVFQLFDRLLHFLLCDNNSFLVAYCLHIVEVYVSKVLPCTAFEFFISLGNDVIRPQYYSCTLSLISSCCFFYFHMKGNADVLFLQDLDFDNSFLQPLFFSLFNCSQNSSVQLIIFCIIPVSVLSSFFDQFQHRVCHPFYILSDLICSSLAEVMVVLIFFHRSSISLSWLLFLDIVLSSSFSLFCLWDYVVQSCLSLSMPANFEGFFYPILFSRSLLRASNRL